jgi:hypothetical protein
MLIRNHIEMTSSVLFRRSILERVGGFSTSLRSAEDYDLLLHIARLHPTSFHGALVAEYRRYEHGGSSLSRNPSVMLRSTMRVLYAQKPFTRGNSFREAQLAKGIRFFQDYYGGELVDQVRSRLHSHEWADAAHGALVLLRYYPRGLVERLLRRARGTRARARLSSLWRRIVPLPVRSLVRSIVHSRHS